MNYYFPIALVVCANVFYHVCAKSIPKDVNPMAGLFITYLVSAAFALICFYLLPNSIFGISSSDSATAALGANSLSTQLKNINWAFFALGFFLVLLELGFILVYRVGWDVSLGSLICNILLALLLIIVGVLFYKEHLTINHAIGIGLCILGLVFINRGN